MKHTLMLCLLLACGSLAYGQPYYLNSFRTGDPATENWSSLGPSESEYGYGMQIVRGRINAIWVNPNDQNSIIAAGDGGGLWKSNDGGNTWRSIIDGAGSASSHIYGINGIVAAFPDNHPVSIAVDPLDTNIIYVALGNTGEDKKSGSYGLGLIYTTDGGATWQQDEEFSSIVEGVAIYIWAPPPAVTKVAFMPGTDQLFAITWGSNQVYMKGRLTYGYWGTITPNPDFYPYIQMGPHGTFCTDFQFTAQAPGKLVVTVNANADTSQLWVFDTAAVAWTEYPMVIPGFTQDNGQGPWQFSLSSTDIAYIQFYDSATSLLLKTPITSFSPTVLSPSATGNNFSANVNAFAVSPANSSVIYTANYSSGCPGGCGTFTQSAIEGRDTSFPWPEISSGEHADGRCLYIWKAYQHPDSDIVFFGCDGGICKKNMDSTHTMSITGSGLAATEFFGMGNTEFDEDYAVSGAQDNGNFSYVKNRVNQWNCDWAGDGFNEKIMEDTGRGFSETNKPALFIWKFEDTMRTGYHANVPVDSAPPALRPLCFDKNDVAYLGMCHIFKRNPGYAVSDTVWLREFYADPIDTALVAGGTYTKQSSDFYIAENDNDSAYVAYNGVSPAGIDPTTYVVFGQLFFSSDAQNRPPLLPPTWTNITPAICTSYPINTIAVDPNNASRIWVGFGGVSGGYGALTIAPGSMTDRVWYSDNAGGSWTDVSAGLPPFPVNKLLYRKGSADEIYAATDAGVFMWNPGTGQWVSFNKGLPPCVVMDMDFNYCASKLRLVTYGRGMWETAMPDIATPAPMAITSAVTLTASVPGHNNIYLQSSIDVQAGGVLTIANDTLHMPKDATISVEPGGRLIVNHAMITNDCDGVFWHGIQARGTCWEPQLPSWQGTVIIKNGSTIANALVGVANSNEGVVWATDGGIIQCINSYFTDNQVCASLRAYDNFDLGILRPNISYFTNCTFLLDNDYKGNTTYNTFEYMVNMKSVEGINFEGCRFLNRDTVAYRGVGEGIHAVNTGFNAEAYCPYAAASSTESCMGAIRSRFCGFSNGINIAGLWQLTLAVNIDQTDFDSVSVGEYVAAFNDVSTTNCNFYVGHGHSEYTVGSSPITSCYQNVGIFNKNSGRFRIEANNFQGFPNHTVSGWYNFGVAIASSGDTATNTVYRSSFDSLDAGVFSAGVNTSDGASGDIGLQILCNAFSDNVNDIAVANDGSGAVRQGIAVNQGLLTGPPAGNTFSNSANNIVDDVMSFNYHYQRYVAAQDPTHVTAGLVSVSFEASAPSCPSTLGGSGGSPDDVRVASPVSAVDNSTLAATKQVFYNNSARLQSAAGVYNSLMDFGSTANLITIIEASVDTAALYTLLTLGSPWLSEAALDTVAADNALPYYSMVQTLKQNPDDLRGNNFLTYVNNVYNFTTADMDTLIARANNITQRTVLEDSISRAQDSMANAVNIIMMALKTPIDTNVSVNDTTGAGICLDTTSVWYGLDSNSVYVGLDSIDTWLQLIGSVASAYERVGYYNFMQQYSVANNIFLSINTSGLSSADQDVYNTYANIWSVLYPGELDSGKIYNLDSAEIAALDVSGQPGFTYNSASVVAYNISVDASTGLGYSLTYPFSLLSVPCVTSVYAGAGFGSASRTGSGTASPPPIVNINRDGNKQFSAYPNPTSGIVTFSYNVQDGASSITIAITNIVGQNVATIYTANNAGASSWDPRALPPGVYLYQASDAKGIISQGKIVVE